MERQGKLVQYLILGASGYIGSYIFEKMKQDGIKVIGTSRHQDKFPELSMYDISTNNIHDITREISDVDKVAIICIAVSNIDQCFENYEHAYYINVNKTKEIIEELVKEDFHVIFFSSDNVFDGLKGNYTETDITNAVNCYGKMKEEIEKFILENYIPACIFRISKVVSSKKTRQNILFEWSQREKNDEEILCIKNNKLSFVAIEDVYQACLISGEKRLVGLYNVGGDRSYTRKGLAELFFMCQNSEYSKVEEKGLEDFHFKDARPIDLSMSNEKFCKKTGYHFTSMEEVIKEFLLL